MSSLKPVPRSYCPDYPRFLTEADIREILRPSLLARFSRETLLAGAMLTGLTAGGFIAFWIFGLACWNGTSR